MLIFFVDSSDTTVQGSASALLFNVLLNVSFITIILLTSHRKRQLCPS